MIVGSLPSSYLDKQFRYDLNDMCHIEGLKGNFPGAKVSSVEIIMAVHIFGYLQKNPGFKQLLMENVMLKVQMSTFNFFCQ